MITPTKLMVYTIVNHIHLETERDDNLVKLIIQLTRSPLKLIDGFLQFANHFLWISQNKAFLLRHVNCLINVTIEKHCLNMHLM